MDFEVFYKECNALSVLFVEDYAPIRKKIVEILEDFFKVVIAASDGEEALLSYIEYEKKYAKPFDIVITDIKMPRKDGIELTKSIQKIHEDQAIIVLSAHQESEYLLELINLGISHFIPKPVEPNEIFEVIMKVTKKLNNRAATQTIDSNITILDNDFIWNHEMKTLFNGNQSIELTKNELIIFEQLISKIDCICTTDDLINNFYLKGIDVTAGSIRNLMSRLRKKLPSLAISNLYAIGYKLTKKSI